MNDIASSPRRYPLSSGLDWLVGDFKIDGVQVSSPPVLPVGVELKKAMPEAMQQ